MIGRIALVFFALSSAGASAQDLAQVSSSQARSPNIVVIVSDDAGWADFSMHGSEGIPTPRIDSIARNGIRFAQGYVTASACSPSRAGLMTARYQQRFGHEVNIPSRYSEENGLPLSETMMAEVLHEMGYRCIAIGKWHLGYAERFHPLSRGFDDYFGFLQGARSYRPLEKPTMLNRLLRDREVQSEESVSYMTDDLGEQAAAYVRKHNKRPFFLYLSFNAVHTPMEAKPEVLQALKGFSDARRRTLAAMMISLDQAVGRVLDELEAQQLSDNTILFFVNDNGGTTSNGSSNLPLRGHKGSLFEGGVRVPFVVQWPAVLPRGEVYDPPVSTLDILPTVVAASSGEWRPTQELDGVDLLPYLRGEREGRPHEVLYWRKNASYAIRVGDWKLLSNKGGPAMLFDLSKDPDERTDLVDQEPDRVQAMMKHYQAWNDELVEPRWRFHGKAKDAE